MSEILQGYIALNGQVETTIVETKSTSTKSVSIKGPKLSNAMKKGFKSVLSSLHSTRPHDRKRHVVKSR